MVAGKVKAAMGFQRSPATPKADTLRRPSTSPALHKQQQQPPPPSQAAGHHPPTPPSSNAKPSSSFAKTFGVYFPRSSAQVQPRPPDVADLLRLVEELQERESRLRTQLLEQKLLQESAAIVPFLEKEIAAKGDELARAAELFERLKADNLALRDEAEVLSSKIRIAEEESQRMEKRIRDLETELAESRKAASEHSNGDYRRLCPRAGGDSDECSSSQRYQGLIDAPTRSNSSRSFRKIPKSAEIGPNQDAQKQESRDPKAEEGEGEKVHHPPVAGEKDEISRPRTPRVPRPPPTPATSGNSTNSCSSSSSSSETTSGISKSKPPNLASLPPIPPPPPSIGSRPPPSIGSRLPPPPPPPPPPSKGSRSGASTVRRVPEVVEFYHSLMRREPRKDSASGLPETSQAGGGSNARDMIGEIENRSAHLLAIKSDVETQGDFIRFLIKEVENAAFVNIEDVVAFVKWLDDELSYLVDERAVLKRFDWPEQKADAMREAAFGYCDFKKLEGEVASFRDDPRQHCSSVLKKMQALLEKLEQAVYNISRVREGATKRYKGFGIPCEWMQESGYVNQIKLTSVKLAMKCMRRVSSELEIVAGTPEEEELMLQAVRFAFRVHQFAGGFDTETMRAFLELKKKARNLQLQTNQQKLYCRSTSC